LLKTLLRLTRLNLWCTDSIGCLEAKSDMRSDLAVSDTRCFSRCRSSISSMSLGCYDD
jgi:hypothetical protein